MADITASDIDEAQLERVRGERLRSVVPVTIAALALFGILIAGSLALRTFIDFGALLLRG